MTKNKKTKSNWITKLDDNGFRDLFLKNMKLKKSPEMIMGEIRELYEEGSNHPSSSQKSKDAMEAVNKRGEEVAKMLSLDTKYIMIDSVHKDYTSFALDFAEQLEREFDVKTASEKSLVQSAVSAYCRVMRFSTVLNQNFPPSLFPESLRLTEVVTKEIDRANRQYLTCLQVLEQKKRPPMKVNVRTNTAFIAENQQNIAHQNSNEKLNDHK